MIVTFEVDFEINFIKFNEANKLGQMGCSYHSLNTNGTS